MISRQTLIAALGTAIAALLCLLLPQRALAQIPGPAFDTLAGARSIGMGRAFSAIADDPSAIRINPAGLSVAKYVAVGTLYQNNQDPRDHLNEHTFTVVDSKSSNLAGGVAYSIVNDNALGFIGTDFKPPAYSLLSVGLSDSTLESFKFGATFHWIRTDFPVTWTAEHEFDFTIGALIPLRKLWGLQIGVVGRNLLGSKKRFILTTDNVAVLTLPNGILNNSIYSRLLPREFDTTGVITPLDILRVAGGININFDSTKDKGIGYNVGAEVEVVKELRLRAGMRRDSPTGDHFLGLGIGLEGAEGSLIYAYERNFSIDTNQHTVELFIRWL